MEQPEDLVAGAQRHQGDGAEAGVDAAVARVESRVLLGRYVEERQRVVGPGAAAGGEQWVLGVGVAAHDKTARALQARPAVGVAAETPIGIPDGEGVLGAQELVREPERAGEGVVLALFEAQTDGFQAGGPLQYRDDAIDRLPQRARVSDGRQDLGRRGEELLHAPTLRDVFARAERGADSAIVVPEHRVVPRDEALVARRRDDAVLEVLPRRHVVRHELHEGRADGVALRSRERGLEPVAADHVAFAAAQHLAGLAVGEQHAPVGGDGHEHHVGYVEISLGALALVREGRLRLTQVGDVAHHADATDDPALSRPRPVWSSPGGGEAAPRRAHARSLRGCGPARRAGPAAAEPRRAVAGCRRHAAPRGARRGRAPRRRRPHRRRTVSAPPDWPK